jgi:hypothetical protein
VGAIRYPPSKTATLSKPHWTTPPMGTKYLKNYRELRTLSGTGRLNWIRTLKRRFTTIFGAFTTELTMLNKRLQEILSQHPDDFEVILATRRKHGYCFENEFSIDNMEVNHCNYTTKWQSNIDHYSFVNTKCEYRDEVKGELVNIEIPMVTKRVIVLEG